MISAQDQPDRLAEYRACLEQVQQSTQRQWQIITVAAGVYEGVIGILISVLPSDFYSLLVKVTATWIGVGALALANGVFAAGMMSEIFWQQVAFVRMVQLEESLGFRLMTDGYLLIKRPWLGKSSKEKDADLHVPNESEVTRLKSASESRKYGLVPSLYRPEYARPLAAVLCILQVLLIASATVMTTFLITKTPSPSPDAGLPRSEVPTPNSE